MKCPSLDVCRAIRISINQFIVDADKWQTTFAMAYYFGPIETPIQAI